MAVITVLACGAETLRGVKIAYVKNNWSEHVCASDDAIM